MCQHSWKLALYMSSNIALITILLNKFTFSYVIKNTLKPRRFKYQAKQKCGKAGILIQFVQVQNLDSHPHGKTIKQVQLVIARDLRQYSDGLPYKERMMMMIIFFSSGITSVNNNKKLLWQKSQKSIRVKCLVNMIFKQCLHLKRRC